MFSAGLYVLMNTVHNGHGSGQRGEPVCAVPERWLHSREQALGHPHWQQDVVREANSAGTTQASLPPAGRPQHLLWVQVRITLVPTQLALKLFVTESFHLSFSSPGFVISWISPQAGLFVSLSIRQQLAGHTAALRNVLSPKPTSPSYVYICIDITVTGMQTYIKMDNTFMLLYTITKWSQVFLYSSPRQSTGGNNEVLPPVYSIK